MIKVNEKYSVDSDRHCYVVMQNKTSKTKGNEYTIKCGYYATLYDALKSIVEREQREIVQNKDMNLKEALEKIEKMYDEFNKILMLNEILPESERKNER